MEKVIAAVVFDGVCVLQVEVPASATAEQVTRMVNTRLVQAQHLEEGPWRVEVKGKPGELSVRRVAKDTSGDERLGFWVWCSEKGVV